MVKTSTRKNKKSSKKSIVKKRTTIKHTRKISRKVLAPSSLSLIKNTKGRLSLFQKRLPQDEFQNISNNSNVDCCPCVFSALGLGKPDIIKELQTKSTVNLGLNSDVIVEQFNHPDYTFHFMSNNAYDYNKKRFLRLIFKSLNDGYGTIGGWTDANNMRHCILFGKYNNKPLFVDAQQFKSKTAVVPPEKQLIIGLKNIEKHFNDKQNIYVLLAIKKDDVKNGLIID